MVIVWFLGVSRNITFSEIIQKIDVGKHNLFLLKFVQIAFPLNLERVAVLLSRFKFTDS